MLFAKRCSCVALSLVLLLCTFVFPASATTEVYSVSLSTVLSEYGIDASSITHTEIVNVSSNNLSRTSSPMQAVSVTTENENEAETWIVMCMDTSGNTMTPTISSNTRDMTNRNVTFESNWPSDLNIVCGISCIYERSNYNEGRYCRPYRIGGGWKTTSDKTVTKISLKYTTNGSVASYDDALFLDHIPNTTPGQHQISGSIYPSEGSSKFIVKEMLDSCFVTDNLDLVATAQMGFVYDGTNYVTEKVTVLPSTELG